MTDLEELSAYLEHRPLMFSVAYRMTGSVSDAEDIVQEAYLRLAGAIRDGVTLENPKAFLTTVTTRLAIDQLRSARVRRESYVGTWLPEPLLTDALFTKDVPGPAERAELSDSLSIAFLVMLESLSPVERAVFLLHEVFGYSLPEIAGITGKSDVNARQILSRARRRLGGGHRFPASRAEGEEVARRFLAALGTGDIAGLLDVLAPDVVAMGDGGGRGAAARSPIAGRDKVAVFLRTVSRGGFQVEFTWVNGQPGAVGRDRAGKLIGVIALDVADGKVQAIRAIVNPDKLGHLGPLSELFPRD